MGEMKNEYLSVRIKRTLADGLTVTVQATQAVEDLLKNLGNVSGSEPLASHLPINGTSVYVLDAATGNAAKFWKTGQANRGFSDDATLAMTPFVVGSSREGGVTLRMGNGLSRTTSQIRTFCGDLKQWIESLIEQRLQPLEFTMTATAVTRRS